MTGKPGFKAFLSHRYKSPEANQRVFDILSAHGDVRFEVDEGVKATNVTRLERLVRDADAFVGIYPFPAGSGDRPGAEEARQASRYFRLELDLAVRARRPAIAFVDQRYGKVMALPASVRMFRFDEQELLGGGSDRYEAQLARLAGDFCADVAATMRLGSEAREARGGDRVGIAVPWGADGTAEYSDRELALIEARLTGMSLEPVRLPWPPVPDGAFLSTLETFDWMVVDIGANACATGLPAFLHGRFMPQMRLVRADRGDTRSPLETSLLAPYDAGYPKDIIRWTDEASLGKEFAQRLSTLYEPRRYIGTPEEARAYFAGAALRKETVFLSYSGEDREYAAALAAVLRQRFQQVFDYRDQGESIVPGRRWIEEVFDKLSASAVGVALVSQAYFASGNCEHEARHLVALADSRKLRLVPVKIKAGDLELPSWMQDLQYLRGWEYGSPEALAERIVAALGA